MVKLLTLRFASLAGVGLGGSPSDAVHETLTDPPPGVDPIAAHVLEAEEDGEDVVAKVRLNAFDWVVQSVQYGEDIYEVLNGLKGQLTAEEMAELVARLKRAELTAAVISTTPDGEIDAYQSPADPW